MSLSEKILTDHDLASQSFLLNTILCCVAVSWNENVITACVLFTVCLISVTVWKQTTMKNLTHRQETESADLYFPQYSHIHKDTYSRCTLGQLQMCNTNQKTRLREWNDAWMHSEIDRLQGKPQVYINTLVQIHCFYSNSSIKQMWDVVIDKVVFCKEVFI